MVDTSTYTKAQKDRVLSYITPFVTTNSGLSSHRSRLEKIDRLIERSYDSLPSKDNCRDKKIPMPAEEENITLPVVGPQLSTLAAQLTKIFLRTDPPVQMFAAPNASEIANQYNILYSRYSRKFQWRRNLLRCIRDAVNYNFCAAEVRWAARAVKTITSEVSTQTGQNKVTTSEEEGEQIKHINAYNVIWDGSVPLNEVSSRGAYAGYIEQHTRISLAQHFTDEGIKLSQADWKEITKYSETNTAFSYFLPKINEVEANESVEPSFDSIFDSKSSEVLRTATDKYNLITLYLRVIPMDFDIISEYGADVSILKVKLVGDNFIVKMEILDNQHNLIPIIFGQMDETSIGLNSFTTAEELAPIQNTATKLYNAEIASTRRLISDRALYDPHLISSSDVNNPSPTAKIPVKSSMHGSFALTQAYYPIPYEDRAMGVRINFANTLLGFSSQITSANQTMQGQFVKGNKSAGEFNTTMQMAGDRLIQSAIFLDDQFFGPLRTILLRDTLQYQSNIRVYDKEAAQFIDVDMATLRSNELDFDVAAGLLPANEMASLEFFQVLVQSIMARPDLSSDFKMMEAICYVAEMNGVKYLRRFLKSAEQKQQEQQAMMQQQLQMLQAKTQIESQGKPQTNENLN